MNRRRKPSSRRWNRRGLTLLECLVGLVILGTVLSSVLLARARYIHQAAVARRRVAAVAAADALLSRWWAQSVPNFIEDNGKIEGMADLSWRTRFVPQASVAELGVRVLRLEILDDRLPAGAAMLVRTDIVVPAIPPATLPAGKEGGSGTN